MINSKQKNLNFEPRMNRLQRMIHVLFHVQSIKSPLRITEHSKKLNAKNLKKINESPTVVKQQGIKRLPKPTWVVYNALPFIGRINLRFFAGWWNLFVCILGSVFLYYKYFKHGNGNDGTEQVGGYEYRDPTRL